MVTILVTGANGQVGSELQHLAQFFNNFTFIFTDVAELDITDEAEVMRFAKTHPFDYCINCAAYTAVDKAETNVELARKINVTGAVNLAKASHSNNALLFQISTDYVYHNTQNTPFKEGDPTNPQGVYAQTKLDGDLAAQQYNANTMVIRTSWVYSTFGHNFVKTMLRLGKDRDKLTVIFDQIGTPTYARDLARAMLQIIQKIENEEIAKDVTNGVFHYSNEGVTSWYDFAQAIFDVEKINCKVSPIETKDYPTPAKRPPFSLLNKGKIKATFGIEIPYWRESLKKCLEQLR
ncbi:MAG: dTDP-4-dehydrorhamnose reductase [Saprospiraceae bacterium]